MMISVFEMFSIGIGPSSSHTVGPMRAAKLFTDNLAASGKLAQVATLKCELYGSLGQTGIGHGTGKAVILGLAGQLPESCDPDAVPGILKKVEDHEQIDMANGHSARFPREGAIVFHRRKTLKEHSNGMELIAYDHNKEVVMSEIYFSIGGSFIVKAEDFANEKAAATQFAADNPPPYPFNTGAELLKLCKDHGLSIAALMMENEKAIRTEAEIVQGLGNIWQTMHSCIQRGIKTEGILPGGLKVKRRAPALSRRLCAEKSADPLQVMDWVNLFALAVNEENAAGGRVVTAPTNGAAGIIPAVLAYYDKFIQPVTPDIYCRYLLTAAAIGILYKKNASISGAEVGCQGEVGVACSMAAAALTEILGGSVDNVENAAEIGMEHNLGLTCDPVGGLVQVPCIERNAMGAVKAINASRLALRGTGEHKVSLDKVIKTMWDTGRDMQSKYKETSRGGLAVNIIEC